MWMFLSDISPYLVERNSSKFCCLFSLWLLWLWFLFRGLLGSSYSSVIPWRHWRWLQRWGGRETVSSPETSLEQERFLHVHRLWKEVTITEVMLEWPEVADILNSKLTKSLIFRWLDKLVYLSVSVLLFMFLEWGHKNVLLKEIVGPLKILS